MPFAGHRVGDWGILMPYLAGRGTLSASTQIAGCVYCAGELDGSSRSPAFAPSAIRLPVDAPSGHGSTTVWVVPVTPLTGQLKAFTKKCLDVPSGFTPNGIKHLCAGKNNLCLDLTGGNSTNDTPVSVLILFGLQQKPDAGPARLSSKSYYLFILLPYATLRFLLMPSSRQYRETARTYELNVKSISGIDLKYQNQNLYVAIDVDSKRMHTTHPKKDFVAMWNDTSTLRL
ncbi:hypothetical protein C8J57DRAFT_1456971 [Mycena rebaudengoi]|nr:hypothetical protein C8J57DRAFT_1456971 [Mycena rebaudengoi]